MIQRIQSVYFGLAGLLASAVVAFPISAYAPDPLRLSGSWVVFGFALLAAGAWANIFNFKDRKRQFVIGRLLILLSFGMFITVLAPLLKLESWKPGYALMAPLGAVILLSLANRAVQKDEELVKESKRFR